MTWTAKYRKQRIGALTAAIIATVWMPSVMAMTDSGLPEVLHSDGVAKNEGKSNAAHLELDVTKDKSVATWTDFSIAKNHSVNFHRENGGSWQVLNRVTGNNLSEIYGKLSGDTNGTIFLVNPHGITFGAGAQVDVGSFVASTREITDDNFNNNTLSFYTLKDSNDNNIDGNITISNGADVKATDGYVALIAHKIYNSGNITAPDVALTTGNEIELKYDDKIYIKVDVSKDENKHAIIETNNNYVLMRSSDVTNIANQCLISNSGKIAATGLNTNEKGEIVLVAANVKLENNSSLSAKDTITTTGYETMQVRDTADVHTDTWNINAKNARVMANPDNSTDGKNPNRVSNTALSNSLADTNVNIVASPDREDYYADIVVKDKIVKTGNAVTSLNLTAGRNVSVDADISSAVGALNITLNSSNKEQTNSKREDGANIVRANIKTNGGDFTSNGTHGTYFGLIREGDNKEAVGTARSIVTNGGNINLNGAEVLVSTGGNVLLDAGNGSVNIEGNVNSANAYYDGGDGNNSISWIAARNAAKGEKTHLAVITSALEDAVATSTVNTDYTKNSQAYVGGHVVKVKTDESGTLLDKDGQQIKFTVNDKGDMVLLTSTPVMADDYLNIDDNGKVETFGTTNHIGWYKIVNADNAEDTRYVRFWAWTEGSEFGKVFFVQTTGETILGKDMENSTDSNWLKEHGFALNTGVHDEVYYTNFTPKEPNDDKGHDKTNGSEMALTVNYDTHNGGNEILYSQWNDTADVKDDNVKHSVKHYVVEEELGKTSLIVNAQDVNINGEIGNLTNLKSVDINAAGNVFLNGLVNVDDTISVKGTDITIKDTLNAEAANVDNAIVLRAQNNFINAVPDSANALKVGEGSHWKVYSNTPFADTLGDLNSNNFAEWGWNGTAATSATGNLFIFKYNPTLTFTANNASKKYGETLSDTGYTFKNELNGLYTNNFYDGNDTKLKEHYSLNNVGTKSDGYPASAPVGTYAIDFTNAANTAENHGYTVLFNPGKLTVTNDNPEDVRPQIDPHNSSTVSGSASYTEAGRNVGPGADRVLGLQSAELPFFREESGQVKLYGTYDVSIDPDKVKMEPTAKVLPEPDQPKNQYREYEKELTTPAGAAKFMLTYNGSTFDIYPVDNSAKALLMAGDAAKNVDVSSQALFAAFKEMGITLDDLDGVYTHFDGKKEVLPFRR